MILGIVTMRASDEDTRLIQSFASISGQSVSSFVREAVLDRIEDELEIDEKRVLAAWEKSKIKRGKPAEQLWKEMGL